MTTGDGVGPGADGPRARGADGVEHLQAAARELISAFRAILDAAEELVDDPAAAGAVAESLGAVVRGAARMGRQATGAVPDHHDDHDDHDDGTGGGQGRGPDTSRVQRIRVV